MPRVRIGKESLEGNGAGHIIINISSGEGCIRDVMAMCNAGRSCLIRETPVTQYCLIRAVVATSLVLFWAEAVSAAFKRRATGYVGDSRKSALVQPESEPGQRAGGGSSQSGSSCIARITYFSFMLGAQRDAPASDEREDPFPKVLADPTYERCFCLFLIQNATGEGGLSAVPAEVHFCRGDYCYTFEAGACGQ